ncbi:MAG: hypothetical protein AAGE80_04125 [Pseudomonadota bacterium]
MTRGTNEACARIWQIALALIVVAGLTGCTATGPEPLRILNASFDDLSSADFGTLVPGSDAETEGVIMLGGPPVGDLLRYASTLGALSTRQRPRSTPGNLILVAEQIDGATTTVLEFAPVQGPLILPDPFVSFGFDLSVEGSVEIQVVQPFGTDLEAVSINIREDPGTTGLNTISVNGAQLAAAREGFMTLTVTIRTAGLPGEGGADGPIAVVSAAGRSTAIPVADSFGAFEQRPLLRFLVEEGEVMLDALTGVEGSPLASS